MRPAFNHSTNPARGVVNPDRPHMKQSVVAFDIETFDQIRARAVSEGTSFAEQVRLLVEWGLEAANTGAA